MTDMTDTQGKPLVEQEEWLIRKGGYFYRPNCAGYTTRKIEAGRYSKTEAEKEAAIEPWHMSAIHQDEVPDEPAVVSLTSKIAALEKQVETLTRERDEARAQQRMSVDRDGNERLHLCRGGHEKSEKCEWETWVPIARAEAAERRLAEQGKAQGETLSDARPAYWKHKRKHGFQYAAKQLHFQSKEAALAWVREYWPDEISDSEAGWADDAPMFEQNIWSDLTTPPSPEPDAELVEALELALEPFADFATSKVLENDDEDTVNILVTIGELRAASEALARHRKQGGE